jgi:hypothetical protein
MKKDINQKRLEMQRKVSTASDKELEADNARLRESLAKANAKIEKLELDLRKHQSKF